MSNPAKSHQVMYYVRQRVIRSAVILAVAACFALSCGDGGLQDPGGGKIPTIPGVDTIPPAAVLGLVAKTPKASAMSLVWFAPGDDGQVGQAAEYDVRYSLSPIDASNWDGAARVGGLPAPKPANNVETITVFELPSEADIYFALKTRDEAGNESDLSNTAVGTTLNMPPAPVADLRAKAVSDTEFLLTWTATGDDGTLRTASYYDIRYSKSNITAGNWGAATQASGEGTPKGPGEPDSFTVSGLSPNTNYFFALKIADEVPNWSLMSNITPAFAYGVDLWVTPTYIILGDEVKIAFRSSPTEFTQLLVYEQVYQVYPNYIWVVCRHLVTQQLDGDVYNTVWDCRDDEGNLLSSYWGEQYYVKLHWGDTVVDSTMIRINPSVD